MGRSPRGECSALADEGLGCERESGVCPHPPFVCGASSLCPGGLRAPCGATGAAGLLILACLCSCSLSPAGCTVVPAPSYAEQFWTVPRSLPASPQETLGLPESKLNVDLFSVIFSGNPGNVQASGSSIFSGPRCQGDRRGHRTPRGLRRAVRRPPCWPYCFCRCLG